VLDHSKEIIKIGDFIGRNNTAQLTSSTRPNTSNKAKFLPYSFNIDQYLKIRDSRESVGDKADSQKQVSDDGEEKVEMESPRNTSL
jgi:hypothetical protein